MNICQNIFLLIAKSLDKANDFELLSNLFNRQGPQRPADALEGQP